MSTFNKVFSRTFNPGFGSLKTPVFAGGDGLLLLAAWEEAGGVSQTLVKGVGPVTTTHPESILQPDHEGIYKEFVANEAVWRGARTGRNLLRYPEDLTKPPWAFTDDSGTATQSGNTFHFGASAADRIVQSAISVVAGETFVSSIEMSGSGIVRLYVFDGNGAATGGLIITLSSTPKRYTHKGLIATTGSNGGMGIYNDNGAGLADFTIVSAQLEDATGRTVLTTGSELVTNGGFDADTDWTKEAGWTIADGVASCDGTQTGYVYLWQDITVTVGKTYIVSAIVSNYSAGSAWLYLSNTVGVEIDADGVFTCLITPVAITTLSGIRTNVDFVGSIDNVSVLEVSADSKHDIPSEYCPNDTAVGEEKNPNSAFLTDASGYVGSNASATFTWVSAGIAQFNNVADWAYVRISPLLDLPAGKYIAEFTIVAETWVGATMHIGFGTAGNNFTGTTLLGTHTHVYDHTGGTVEFQTRPGSTGTGTINFSSISVKEATTGRCVFSTELANSVTDNVVTEAVGDLLADAPWEVSQGDATNSCKHSRDLTGGTWAGPATPVYNQVGLEGLPNTASILDDVSASLIYVRCDPITVPADTNTHVLKVYFKKDTNNTVFPGFQLREGSDTVRSFGMINTSTGAISLSSLGDTVNIDSSDCGLFWCALIEWTNDSSYTSVDVSVYAAWGDVWGDTYNAASTRTCIIGNVEVHLNKTIEDVKSLGPIFTTTAPASTSAFDNEYPAANHSNTQGPLYIEFSNTGDDAEIIDAGGDAPILECCDGGVGTEMMPADTFLTGIGGWAVYGTNTVATITGVDGVEIAYGDTTNGGYLFFNASKGLTENLTVGEEYTITFDAKINTGSASIQVQTTSLQFGLFSFSNTNYITYDITFIADHTETNYLIVLNLGAGEVVSIKDISFKVSSRVLKLSDGTNQITTACAAGDHAAGVSYSVTRGDELVTNGGFDSGLADWTDGSTGNGSVVESGGKAVLTGTDGSNRGGLQQAIADVVNKKIYISFEADITSGNSYVTQHAVGTGGVLITQGLNTVVSTGYFSTIIFYTASGGAVISIDNVSIKEVTSKMNLNLDGVWETEVDYDESFGTGVLTVAEDARNIRRYSKTGMANQKSIIDKLMT